MATNNSFFPDRKSYLAGLWVEVNVQKFNSYLCPEIISNLGQSVLNLIQYLFTLLHSS